MKHRHWGLPLIWVALIFLFLWNEGGTIIWQSARSMHYRERHKEACKDTITITNSDLSNSKILAWVEKDEVRYQGKMFDIKRTISKDGNTMLIGHYDEDDDKLFKWLVKLIDDDTSDPSSKTKLIRWNFEATMPYLFTLQPNYVITYKKVAHYSVAPLAETSYSPPVPPPEYC